MIEVFFSISSRPDKFELPSELKGINKFCSMLSFESLPTLPESKMVLSGAVKVSFGPEISTLFLGSVDIKAMDSFAEILPVD